MSSFLETLNYSSSNEDSRSELDSLFIAGTDSILAITGSGARSLDLLVKNPERVVSLDFNPCQSHLLELKMAAMHHLAYEEFLAFLGVCPCVGRTAVYRGLRDAISGSARDYWDRHQDLIEAGVVYQGRWERYFSLLARMVGLARRDQRRRLFECTDVREQADLWNRSWDDAVWRRFLGLISSRPFWRYLLRDPGFYQHVPAGFSVYDYLSNRFSSAFNHVLMSGSPFATLLMFGAYDPDGPLPLHLQRGNYQLIRNNLGCIQVVTRSLSAYLEPPGSGPFQGFSLSDFASYTSAAEYADIWQHLVGKAAAGAVACERQFLVKRGTPVTVQARISRNEELEDRLARQDNSIFYTFVVATIR